MSTIEVAKVLVAAGLVWLSAQGATRLTAHARRRRVLRRLSPAGEAGNGWSDRLGEGGRRLVASLPAERRRQLAAREAAVAPMLETVAAELRGGRSLHQALVAASGQDGPLASGLANALDQIGAGLSRRTALRSWATEESVTGLSLAVAAIELAGDLGGGQARAIDGVAATVRSRLSLQAELRSLTAQARLSAQMMAAIPPFFTLLATATDRRTGRFLLATGPGLACLASGLALDVIGLAWMRRITGSIA